MRWTENLKGRGCLPSSYAACNSAIRGVRQRDYHEEPSLRCARFRTTIVGTDGEVPNVVFFLPLPIPCRLLEVFRGLLGDLHRLLSYGITGLGFSARGAKPHLPVRNVYREVDTSLALHVVPVLGSVEGAFI